MEAMLIWVRRVTAESGTLTAFVTATSRERLRGRPIARIEIALTLPALPGEKPRDSRERVRDEALRFLDIA